MYYVQIREWYFFGAVFVVVTKWGGEKSYLSLYDVRDDDLHKCKHAFDSAVCWQMCVDNLIRFTDETIVLLIIFFFFTQKKITIRGGVIQ